MQLLPNSFWKEEIGLAALPAEGQGETSLTRETFEVLPVPARNSAPH